MPTAVAANRSAGPLGVGRHLLGPSLQRMGVAVDRELDVGSFSSGQRRFLEFHWDQVFLQARARAS